MSPIDPFSVQPGEFLQAVGFRLDEIDPAEVAAKGVTGEIDVDERHHTPWGVVHGGVWATVVESAASVGASLAVRDRGEFAVGVDNVTDFLRPVRRGRIRVIARAEQIGRSMQLWQVDLTDEQGKTVARGRVRLANQKLPE
ncbi:MAG TPA: PaaI family thioesterase [Trebonia sp.]|jgi:uncharacterized protein (TIGR00369 family)|nr:PaaI family thioesterase [Trebonia sp.]